MGQMDTAGDRPASVPAAEPTRFARVRRWIPAARIVASAIMLGVLVHQVKIRSIFPQLDAPTLALLAGGLAFTTLGIVLSAYRWQRVLVAMELPSKLGPLLNAYLASQFLSNFLPSTIGGDALRVSRLSATQRADPRPAGTNTGGTPAAFASVVLDRMSGWLILPLLCLAGLVINPTLLHLGRSSHAALAISGVTLVTLVAVVAAAGSARLGGRFAGHDSWLRFMGAVHLGLARMVRRPRQAAQVIVASIVYQLAIVAAGILAAKALGIDIGPTALLAFIPAVAIVQVLPVTVGGLGVREGAFALFLQPLGVPAGKAIGLGLAMYAMHLLASLLGAPSFAIGQRSGPAPVSMTPVA
ncbi:MAG: lysylphosphatidylglycerol synthase transmembrane domain-containing protein [Acidimicrobiales bacterium]